MSGATLKIDERESPIGEGGAVFGRSAECSFAFPDNPNISRRHAEIRVEDGNFVIEDLGSSNGTTINGQPITGPTELNDGDFITLGNSIIVEFLLDEPDENEAADAAAAGAGAVGGAVPAGEDEKKGKFPTMLAVAGGAVGLAVVMVVAAVGVVVMRSGPSGCDAAARIVSPSNGETIKDETTVKISVSNSQCVSEIIVMAGDRPVATLDSEPYEAKLDPANFADFADGLTRPLSLIVVDSSGQKYLQSRGSVELAFETRRVATPTPTVTMTPVTGPTVAAGQKQASLLDLQKMMTAVVGKFGSGSVRYNLANQELLNEVRRRTPEFSAAGGYTQRALQYKEVIDQTFIREKALDPAIPYLIAMSRSKFQIEKDATGEGLWRMTPEFVAANAYDAACTNKSLVDPAQECAAKSAALYFEDLVVKTFDGDIVYAVASIGKTAQEANAWKSGLPADRGDFWKIVTDPGQRESIARFFAAAVVAENPQKFGLKSERAISDLYPPVTR